MEEFERSHQILKLVPVIPTHDPQLEPECYESILTAALYSRTDLFKALINHWNPDLYRIGNELFTFLLHLFFNHF